MKYAIVDPTKRVLEVRDFAGAHSHDALHAAERAVGLDPFGTDSGVVVRGIGIFVSEFGLYEPVDRQHYFAIGTRLYAGPAVLFAYDESGDTVDFVSLPSAFEPRWLDGQVAIEAAIACSEIARPVLRMNGELMWEWPQPKPATVFGTHP